MRSRANFRSHPLHPILVCFPIAFYTGTVIADVFRIVFGYDQLSYTAYLLNIGGIAGSVLAAVPGLIDFIYTVPPKSSGKKRAAKHAVTNVIVLLLFIVALLIRRNPDFNLYSFLAIEVIAFLLLGYAGWMGGTLVFRNQIGVDVRYANAGKWKEDSFSGTQPIDVGSTDQLSVNQMKLLHVDGKRIVLARNETKYVAFDDHCTHRGGSLAAGVMICGKVQCPWHGSQFDTATGQCVAGPAKHNIHCYTVNEVGGRLMLTI